MKLAIVIPTVPGREAHLGRCIRGYVERTPPDVALHFEVISPSLTCGAGWQAGAVRAAGSCADYLLLTADDIVPGVGWFEPCKAIVDAGGVPAMLVCEPAEDMLDPHTGLPYADNRTSGNVHFFEGDSGPDRVASGHVASGGQYASVPFCSREQWGHIAPMIPAHYGTDKWFSHRAREAGYPIVACHEALVYHHVAQEGRIPSFLGWTHTDLLDFDLNVAYPLYLSGALNPYELDARRGTPAGREASRQWRVANLPNETVRPWDDPNLGEEYR